MIRYPSDPAKLRADIEAYDPNWFRKARERTRKFIEIGRFDEKTSIWSNAKPAFMMLQNNKCAFCERTFSRPDESRIEMDLEHFRPKKEVTRWTMPKGEKPYPSDTGEPSPDGYYWLAYDIWNYAAVCKICNTGHKGSCFPIAGLRCTTPGDPASLAAEQPYLVYPIGPDGDDPEDLITFTGTIARPVVTDGPRHRRAALIIDFFGLNTQDQLHIQRAEIIERFGGAFIAIAEGRGTDADRTYAGQTGNPLIPHAACLRAFRRLWDWDQAAARRLYTACRDMLAKRLIDSTASGLGVGLV